MKPASPRRLTGTSESSIDIAERLCAERGFAGTSAREITDATAANLGAVMVSGIFTWFHSMGLDIARQRPEGG